MSGTHPHAPQLRREMQADHKAGVVCPPIVGLSFVDEDEAPHGRSVCWDAGARALEGLRVYKIGVASLTLRREVGYVSLEVLLPVNRHVLEAVPVHQGASCSQTHDREIEEGCG